MTRRRASTRPADLRPLFGAAASLLLGLGCEAGGYSSLGSDGVGLDGSEPGAQPGGALSGLPWPSGTNAQDLDRIAAWASYRGRPADVALVITDYTSWPGITQPDGVLEGLAGFTGKLVIALPFWPNGVGGSLAACARGEYDDHWRTLGATLVAHDRARSIIRLAWQFNGNDVAWSASDPVAWVSCYRHVVTAVREAAPEALFDWSRSAHGTQNPASGDASEAYPGDEYVDVIGIDTFDMTPSSPDEAAWTQQCNGPDGLCAVIEFARAHGKRVGVGQWAVVTCNGFGDAGGDNPFFIQKMHDTFAASADVMAYETYYNDPNAGEFCTSLHEPVEAPEASALYQKLWGP
ncbi:glycosyl hydrolase [Sorangium sp. So ce260]|uniref:glycoside hydrolase family 26 protein n=1 Tax=Sorangium sp. So ce260 TaxID=3133291 RepID=UPI003F62D58B